MSVLSVYSILSGCYDNTVWIWNTEGDVLSTIPGHASPVKCVTWVNNGEQSVVVLTSLMLTVSMRALA